MIRGEFLEIEDRRRAARWTPPGGPSRTAPLLAGVPLFESVSRRHLRKIIELVSVEEYGEGVAVVREGSKGEAFHIVLEGKALVELPGGDEIVLKPGDAFGELALIDGAPRSATVVAGRGLCTGRIKRADFRRLLRDEPAIAVGLLPGLVGVIRSLEGGKKLEGASSRAGASRHREE
jgi:CRP-like cAMP-binding protein